MQFPSLSGRASFLCSRYSERVHAAIRGRNRAAPLSGGFAGRGGAQKDASSHQGLVAQTSGPESDVRDHRGVLGPRRRGATVGRLRGGAHRADREDDQRRHQQRQPRLHSNGSHQRRPTSQRVQHLSVATVSP